MRLKEIKPNTAIHCTSRDQIHCLVDAGIVKDYYEEFEDYLIVDCVSGEYAYIGTILGSLDCDEDCADDVEITKEFIYHITHNEILIHNHIKEEVISCLHKSSIFPYRTFSINIIKESSPRIFRYKEREIRSNKENTLIFRNCVSFSIMSNNFFGFVFIFCYYSILVIIHNYLLLLLIRYYFNFYFNA